MILRNYTRFRPFVFESRDPQDREFGVLVLQGSFRLVSGGSIQLEELQPSVAAADVFHGPPGTSSMRREGGLAPFKRRADIHIHAVAHAPGGWPTPSWLVRARIGKLDTSLRVTGPRRWVRDGSALRLTEPEPCSAVPLRYEYAFGGIWRTAWGTTEAFEENPVGKGYVPENELPSDLSLDAPQIEKPGDPIGEIGRAHAPAGFGPIPPSWLPRRALAGTFDEAWRKERWPRLPADFDYAFYNSAHPDLTYPGYLQGDEEVALENLHPSGTLEFRLPSYQVGLLAQLTSGTRAVVPMLLDTLMIDVPEERVLLTWRGTFSKRRPIAALEACMAVPRETIHG